MMRWIGTALAALALGGTAAAAEPQGWDAASAAYLRGKASDLRPESSIEIAYCTGYWEALVAANEKGLVPAAVIRQIEASLVDEDIDLTFEGWAFMLDGSQEARDASDEAAAEGYTYLTQAAAGEIPSALEYFELLGACQFPPLAQ